MDLSIEQILALAPNPASAKRAQTLVTTKKWEQLNRTDRAIWGHCKGSGSRHYQCGIDLNGPAFKCNCPSRIFPCKHSLALYLLLVDHKGEFGTKKEHPEWLSEWLTKRDNKNTNNSKPTAATQEKAAERKLKTQEKRFAKMTDGVNDLEVWLSDTIRQGLASTEGQDYAFWNDISSRMVDAQLKSIGVRIREMQLLQGANTDWPEEMLKEVANIYLIAKGFKNIDQLPAPLQSQILTVTGINTKRADLEAQTGLKDTWIVIGILEGVNIDNGKYRKTWLIGTNTNQIALILDFDYRNMGYETLWSIGQNFEGELVYYPASYPIRAILKNRTLVKHDEPLPFDGFQDLDILANSYADALAKNPWLSAFPCYIESVIPIYKNDQLQLIDQNKKKIIASHKENLAWKLMAISGNQPINLFGEWTGSTLLPLSVITQSKVIKL